MDCVYLDISHQSPSFPEAHFPNIKARCAELGIDITRQPIPVVPAAHYTCGGVVTDLKGRTDLPGCTPWAKPPAPGLHGANRLASNSLLECMVFAREAVHDILASPHRAAPPLPDWDDSRVTDPRRNGGHHPQLAPSCAASCGTTWALCAPPSGWSVRPTASRCCNAKSTSSTHSSRSPATCWSCQKQPVQVADLIVMSAPMRPESRGLHYSRDFPDTDPVGKPTVLVPRPGEPPAAARSRCSAAAARPGLPVIFQRLVHALAADPSICASASCPSGCAGRGASRLP